MAKSGGRTKNVQIVLQEPIGPQAEAIEHESRFKALNWGRRTGKTRGGFVAISWGHGGSLESPRWPGFLRGGKVLWVTKDYKQAGIVWDHEMKPRFKGKDSIRWREQDSIVEMESNDGMLYVRSAENIDTIRGFDFDIIVIEEAAHWNVEEAWGRVLRATLVDRSGSAIWISSPRSGSYFNQICFAIQAGELGGNWWYSHATAYDNPKIDDAEIEEMLHDLGGPDTQVAQEEVLAKLLVGGGLAFPQWNENAHVYDMEPPENWVPYGTLDWGYSSHGYFGLGFAGPDDEMYGRWEFYFRKMSPYEVGLHIGRELVKRFRPPEFIVCDSDMMYQTEGPITKAEQFAEGLKQACGDMAPPLIAISKVSHANKRFRESAFLLMHQALAWRADPKDKNKPARFGRPKLCFHSECQHARRTFPMLPLDPVNPDDVDTTAEDHPYDAWKNLMSTRRRQAERIDHRELNVDRFLMKQLTGGDELSDWRDSFVTEPEYDGRYQYTGGWG